VWATTPVWPLDYGASNLNRALCAFELAIHELDGCVSGLNRETQGELWTRSARPSRSSACFGDGDEANRISGRYWWPPV